MEKQQCGESDNLRRFEIGKSLSARKDSRKGADMTENDIERAVYIFFSEDDIVDLHEQQIYQTLIEKKGAKSQQAVAIEELAELSKEVSHFLSGRDKASSDRVAEEIADVEIMLGQLKLIHEITDSDKRKERKLREVARRLGV